MEKLFPYPESNGANCTNGQAHKTTPRRCSPPEHAQQESRQQWCIEYREQDLHIVHNTVEIRRDVRGTNAKEDTYYGDHTPHPEVMNIRCVALDIRAIQVIRPDSIKGSHISRH